MQARERRGEHPAQVGDISTLRIRVTFQLGVYTFEKVVDKLPKQAYRAAVLIKVKAEFLTSLCFLAHSLNPA